MKAQEQIDLIDHQIEVLIEQQVAAFSDLEHEFYAYKIKKLYEVRRDLKRKVRDGHAK